MNLKTHNLGGYSVGFTDGSDLLSLRWHDIYTKFYDDQLAHSINIKLIISIKCEAAVLVLWMG
jgi:hypothetical protein